MTGLSSMHTFGGLIDTHDYAFVRQRFGKPDCALPAPIVNHRINPHVSVFQCHGKQISVFHVKPVYYLHRNGQWRPFEEVTVSHGNRAIALNDNWTLIHPSYLKWLMRRAELLEGQVLLPFPALRPVREGVDMHFATSTLYPDPDPETTTVDGSVYVDRGAGVDRAGPPSFPKSLVMGRVIRPRMIGP